MTRAWEVLLSTELQKKSGSLNLSGMLVGDAKACDELFGVLASGELRHLTSLNLSRNMMRDERMASFLLALERGCLPMLQELNVAINGLRGDAIDGFSGSIRSGSFSSLRALDLCGNPIRHRSFSLLLCSLGELRLQTLLLSNTGCNENVAGDVACFGGAGGFGLLEYLDLGFNPLGDTGVQKIFNVFREFAPTKLKFLSLDNVQMHKNSADVLFESIKQGLLPSLHWLNLSQNDIGIPSGVLNGCSSGELIHWWQVSKKNDQGERIFKCKLLLVGEALAGKTHLRRRIVGKEYTVNHREKRTTGVTIDSFRRVLNHDGSQVSVDLLVSDYGGQEKLLQSHRFHFGSDRCFYLLVLRADWSARQNRLDYWLSLLSIHSRNEYGDLAPVLIVVTQSDRIAIAREGSERSKSELKNCLGYDQWDPIRVLDSFQSLEASLIRLEQSCIANITPHGVKLVGVVQGLGRDDSLSILNSNLLSEIESNDRLAMSNLYSAIESNVLNVPGVSDPVPSEFPRLCSWVEKQFRDNQVGYFDCDLPEFQAACNLGRDRSRISSSGFVPMLRSLGYVHFVGDLPVVKRTAYSEAKRWVFNPSWLVEPIYERILWLPIQDYPGGFLTISQFEFLLSYPRYHGGPKDSERIYSGRERNAIAQILYATGVAFEIKERGETIGMFIPDLLPPHLLSKDSFDFWKKDDSAFCQFAISFRFLPERVFFRFIASHYMDINAQERSASVSRNLIYCRSTCKLWEKNRDVSVDFAAHYDRDVEGGSATISLKAWGESEEVLKMFLQQEMTNLQKCCDLEDWKEIGRVEEEMIKHRTDMSRPDELSSEQQVRCQVLANDMINYLQKLNLSEAGAAIVRRIFLETEFMEGECRPRSRAYLIIAFILPRLNNNFSSQMSAMCRNLMSKISDKTPYFYRWSAYGGDDSDRVQVDHGQESTSADSLRRYIGLKVSNADVVQNLKDTIKNAELKG